MLYRYVLVLTLLTFNVFAVISPGDFALVQIASNTLSQLRDLKEIITETREFNEQFESIHSRVETAIWRADRFAMWAEDIKSLEEVDIKSLDDLNTVLFQLKRSKQELQRMWREEIKQKQESNHIRSKLKKDQKRDKKARSSYARDTKLSLTPTAAQIDIAKTNRETLIETSITNDRINRLTKIIEKMNSRERAKNEELLKEEIRLQEQNNQLEKGVLKSRYLKVRR